MRSRRVVALACGTAMLAAIVSVGPAAASTSPAHFTVVGPGVQAFWENAEEGTSTNLLVFQQLNAPGSQGYFQGVLVIREGWADGELVWQSVYDSSASGSAPSVVIRQPLVSASASGTAPIVGCFGPCEGPDVLSFDETWTGTGRITRIAAPRSGDPYFVLDPGVILDMSRGVDFFRVATLGTADPFDGALGDLGTLSTSDPGVRFFDVHITGVTVCHQGAC